MTIERNRKPNSRNHRTNRPVLAGILFFCCLLLAGTGFLYLRLGNGVQIKVSLDKNIPPAAEIICYRQDDAQWGDDKLGSSSYTMRSSGGLVSCIAAALSMERSTEETPGTLNRQFTSGQVYDAEGNLLWKTGLWCAVRVNIISFLPCCSGILKHLAYHIQHAKQYIKQENTNPYGDSTTIPERCFLHFLLYCEYILFRSGGFLLRLFL